jgi:hypothetical protein
MDIAFMLSKAPFNWLRLGKRFELARRLNCQKQIID